MKKAKKNDNAALMELNALVNTFAMLKNSGAKLETVAKVEELINNTLTRVQ